MDAELEKKASDRLYEGLKEQVRRPVLNGLMQRMNRPDGDETAREELQALLKEAVDRTIGQMLEFLGDSEDMVVSVSMDDRKVFLLNERFAEMAEEFWRKGSMS